MLGRQFIVFFFLTILALSGNANAQTLDDALLLPDRLLFTVSGGLWTEETEVDGAATTTRGYYRISAFRREDNTSAVFLQKIANGEDGPEQNLTLEIEEISQMNAFITDMRPESSSGGSTGPGFAVYVYLKPDLQTQEPETYSIYIDDLDEIYVEQASN